MAAEEKHAAVELPQVPVLDVFAQRTQMQAAYDRSDKKLSKMEFRMQNSLKQESEWGRVMWHCVQHFSEDVKWQEDPPCLVIVDKTRFYENVMPYFVNKTRIDGLRGKKPWFSNMTSQGSFQKILGTWKTERGIRVPPASVPPDPDAPASQVRIHHSTGP